MSIALARKYRPRNFASVAVQTHVSRTLRGAIALDRVAHGYLMCGPRGTGKTTLARVLAMALNCEKRISGEIEDTGEPCGECSSCSRIWGGSASLDVVEIDAASNRGVDDARDLRERAMYAPSAAGSYKVYIVDEAHMLTREAWNALLKILEEPPPRVVFVFATTEPNKIAQAAAPVLSRLQRFDLKRIGVAEIRARLGSILESEKVEATPEAIGMIARAADGSMRDALSLTDQVLSHSNAVVDVEGVRESLGLVAEDEYLGLVDIIVERRAADVFPAVHRLAEAGVDFTTLLTGLSGFLRALLALHLGSESDDLSDRAREELRKRIPLVDSGDLLRMLNLASEVEPRFRRSSQQQLLFETLVVRLALLDRTVSIEALLRNVAAGGGAGAGGSGGASAGRGAQAPLKGGESPRPSGRSAAPATAEEHRAERPVSRPASDQVERPVDLPPSTARASEAGTEPLEINRLAEHWDAIVDRLRNSGRGMMAGHLASALPRAVSAKGVVTVQLSESDAAFELVQEALAAAQPELLAALRHHFTGVQKVVLAPPDGGAAAPAAARRMTAQAIRDEKLAMLRKRDAVLDAAVRELDLELLE